MNSKVKRMTVAGVAERAGVSTTTVSLILSDRQEYLRQFHPDTIKRVRDTARRLGYHGNLFASGLPTKESPFFALIVREECASESSTWHQWAFEGDMLAGIIHAASEARLYPIVAQSQSTLTPDTLRPLERVIAGGVFGAIVRTPHPLLEKYLLSRIRMGQAMIVVFPQRISKWPTNAIDVDNVAIGRTAGRLLAGHGRRRWGVVAYKPLREAHAQRIEGFKHIAQKIDAHVEMVQLSLGMDDLMARDYLSPRLKKLKLDGIFSLDSVSSVGTLLACIRLGLQPQIDFHQVGCDCSLWQSTPLPRITAVDISWKEVGIRAVHQLVETSRKGEAAFDSVLLPPRVIAADTCPIPDSMAEIEPGSDRTAGSPQV